MTWMLTQIHSSVRALAPGASSSVSTRIRYYNASRDQDILSAEMPYWGADFTAGWGANGFQVRRNPKM